MLPPIIDEVDLPPDRVPLTLGRAIIGGVILAIVLALLTWSLRGGGAPFHTTLEVVATVIAFGIAVLAFVRYLSRRRLMFLLVATGFIGTGMLDGFHALISSEAYRAGEQSLPDNLVSWSWIIPRIVLGVTLWAGVSNRWLSENARSQKDRIRQESLTYISVSALVLLALVAYAFVPLPNPPITLPGLGEIVAIELIAAIPFGMALWTLWRGGLWHDQAFERWLMLALVLSMLGQIFITPFSHELNDGAFVLAHLVKVTSFGAVFIGLAASMAEIHRGADDAARRLDLALREQAKAERQIRLFQDVVRNMQVGLTVWRLEEPADVGSFRLMATNPAASEITGVGIDDRVGQTLAESFPETLETDLPQIYRQVIETGEPIHLQNVADPMSAVPGVLDVRVFALPDSSIGITFENVADRVHAEAASRTSAERLAASNRDLESFAYVASHDLQEPLRKIIAFGDRLQVEYDRALDERGHDYLSRMKYAATRMQTLIGDLLMLSRVATGVESFTSIDLNEVVAEVASDLEARTLEVGGRIDVQPLPIVQANRTQMRQLFQNLMINALKFHREGVPPVVGIRASLPVAGTGDELATIIVEDNGLGFDMQHLEKIFQPFERLHSRQRIEGSGIGLSICRSIVERHGGTLTAVSVSGEGSTFRISLPTRQATGDLSQ